MPKVGKGKDTKSYPYTVKGIKAAKRAAKGKGMEMEMDMPMKKMPKKMKKGM